MTSVVLPSELPSALHGMRILESPLLVEDGEPYTVRRTWWQRLFTRPWRPRQASYTVTPKVPYRGALRLDAHTLVMHPATLQHLRAHLER